MDEKVAKTLWTKPEGFLQGYYLNQIHLKGNLRYISVVARGGCEPRWSPRGGLIAYVRRRPLPGQFYQGRQLYGEFELWATDLSGEKKRNLTPGGNCSAFAWSPDGKSIAADVFDSEMETSVLLVIVKESGLTPIFNSERPSLR